MQTARLCILPDRQYPAFDRRRCRLCSPSKVCAAMMTKPYSPCQLSAQQEMSPSRPLRRAEHHTTAKNITRNAHHQKIAEIFLRSIKAANAQCRQAYIVSIATSQVRRLKVNKGAGFCRRKQSWWLKVQRTSWCCAMPSANFGQRDDRDKCRRNTSHLVGSVDVKVTSRCSK